MKQSRGFTLIELLVVISIIAIMIAILLPVLSTARDTAKTLQCLSNHRQIGIAMHAYLGDHDATYPRWRIQGSSYDYTRDLSAQYLGGDKAYSPIWHDPAKSEPSSRSAYNWNYLDYGYSEFNIGSHYRYTGSAWSPPAKAVEIIHPSSTYLLIDAGLGRTFHISNYRDRGASVVYGHNAQSQQVAQVRHKSSVNVLFCDGHAASIHVTNKLDPYSSGLTDVYDTYNHWTRDNKTVTGHS